MKLKDACELADACGLYTVGEAVENAELHYDALVLISEMNEEFEELYREAEALGPEWRDKSIYDIVERMCCANCARRYTIHKNDYRPDGKCEHSKPEGFICMAFADEGIATWMVGDDKEMGACEEYVSKNKEKTNWDVFRKMSAERFAIELYEAIENPDVNKSSWRKISAWLKEGAKLDQ